MSDQRFDPSVADERWQRAWDQAGTFHADSASNPEASGATVYTLSPRGSSEGVNDRHTNTMATQAPGNH